MYSDAAHEPAENIGAGDDVLAFTPKHDDIVINDVVVETLRIHCQLRHNGTQAGF